MPNPEAFIPKAGERHIAVQGELCPPDCPCLSAQVCPVGALHREGGNPPAVHHRVCLLCGACIHACPKAALSIQR